MAAHEYVIDGLTVKTGDILCTTVGGSAPAAGEFWRLIGMLIPGAVDHVAIYVGPGGRCVEASAKFKVLAFDVQDNRWDYREMKRQRGPMADTLHGVAYPFRGRALDFEREEQMRSEVADYCLLQAKLGKPYNLNFLDTATEDAFYCSHLAYQAYLKVGIDLNTGMGMPNIPGTKSLVAPQEIWAGCDHERTK
jgi:hypothetical protein